MKIKIFFILILISISSYCVFSQSNKDTLKVKNLNEIIINSPRTEIPLKEMPAAILLQMNS